MSEHEFKVGDTVWFFDLNTNIYNDVVNNIHGESPMKYTMLRGDIKLYLSTASSSKIECIKKSIEHKKEIIDRFQERKAKLEKMLKEAKKESKR